MNQETNVNNMGTDSVSSEAVSTPPQPAAPHNSSGVNLLLGLLPLSTCLTQLPLANIVAPLIGWLCVRKDNPDSKPAFQSVMNMQISWTLYCLAALFLSVILGILMFFSAFACTNDSFNAIKVTNVTTSCQVFPENKGESDHQDEEKAEKETSAKRSSQMWLRLGDGRFEMPFPWGGGIFHSNFGNGKETFFEVKGLPATGIFGVIAGQIAMFGMIAIFTIGAIAWFIATILFAVNLKNNANAKPPLTIRFLK